MDGFWTQVLEYLPWIVLGLCVLIGLIGAIMPGIPGGGLIWGGVLVFAIWTKGEWLSWPTVVIVGILSLVGGIGQYFISGYGAKKFGASKWGAVGAFAGFIIGGIVFPPLGCLIGAFIGAVAVELYLKRDKLKKGEDGEPGDAKGEAKKATMAGLGAVIGSVGSFLFEFVFALVACAVILAGLLI
jgi:uncharacterized protein